MTRRLARGRRGVALVMTMVVLLVVESAALLLAAADARERTLQRDAARRLRLKVLADSAADATLARLAANRRLPRCVCRITGSLITRCAANTGFPTT